MQFPTDDPGELIENLPEALFLEDLNGNILDVNHQACKLLGYERKELLNMKADDLIPDDHPDIPPDQIDKATRKGKPLETTNICEYGTEIPIDLHGKLLEIEGKERMLISIRDISERKEKEINLKKYKTIFEGLTDPVMLKDTEGRYRLVNEALLEYLGFSRKEIIGKTDGELFGKEMGEKMWEKEKQVFETEEVVTYREWLPTEKGERCFKTTRTPYYNPTGSLSGIISICRDITEQKRAERALDEERNKLKELHDAVDKLQQQETEEGVLNTAVNVAETMLDFEICAIDILEGDYLVPRYNSALDLEETIKFKIGEGITGKTMQRGKTIWGDDAQKHPDAKPTNESFRAFISMPIGNWGPSRSSLKR